MAGLSDLIHMMDLTSALPGRRAGGAGLNLLDFGQVLPHTNKFNPSKYVDELKYLDPSHYLPKELHAFLREPGDGTPGWMRGLFDPQKSLTFRVPGLDPLGDWLKKKF